MPELMGIITRIIQLVGGCIKKNLC